MRKRQPIKATNLLLLYFSYPFPWQDNGPNGLLVIFYVMASTAYALHIQIHHNKNIEQKQGGKTALYFMPFCYFAVLGLLLSFFLGVAVRAILLLLFRCCCCCFCTPLKPPIKFIFNGVIKAFYLFDRREL